MNNLYKKANFVFKLSTLAFLTTNIYANNDAPTQLIPINITAHESSPNKPQNNLQGTNKELIASNHELIRNSTDLGITELGRYGSQGFNIRGVEGNRVAINVDGVEQESSHIYPVYDFHNFYNNSRIDIDTELMGDVRLHKGADSSSVTGGLGGAVNYKTKTVDDILLTNRSVGAYLKNAYNGRNAQWINTAGAAFRNQYIDGLILYSRRHGHETQIQKYDNGHYFGSNRSLPDPYTLNQYSYLAKLGFNVGHEHRINLKLDEQHNKSDGYELSAESLRNNHVSDIQQRKSYTANYLYTPTDKWLNLLKFGFTHQNTDTTGHNSYSSQYNANTMDQVFSGKLTQFDAKFKIAPFNIYSSQHNIELNALYNKHHFKTHRITYNDNNYVEMQSPADTNRFNISLADRLKLNNIVSPYLAIHYDHYIFRDKQKNNKVNSSVLSGEASVDFKISPNWSIGYSYNRGFRVPTANELLFSGNLNSHGIISNIKPNLDLKPEYSKTHQLSLKGNGNWGNLSLISYYTQYKNLIEFIDYNNDLDDSFSQYTNTPKAKVYGLDMNGKVKLSHLIHQLPTGLNFIGGLGIAHGKKDKESLLSVQPLRILFGLEYIAPNNDWSVTFQGQHNRAKKAKDTLHLGFDPDEYVDILTPAKYLSSSYTVFDLTAHKNFNKHTSINVGIYNLFNKQYYTWDSLRTLITSNAESNSVGESGMGLERYRAPKRYIMASLVLKF